MLGQINRIMLPLRITLVAIACLAFTQSPTAASSTRTSEIIVSAANYAQTPPDVLEKLFRRPADLVEAPPPPATSPTPHFYQFIEGEHLEADLSYTDVCKLLVPVLGAKNFHNTHDQAKVDFILRVTFGGRTWRDPFVREGDLEWKHGLVPRRRRASASLGSESAWDARAGGNESELYQTERILSEMFPNSEAEGMADRLIDGIHTEDYFLIVVDAFAVADLRTKGNSTKRAWSTFIAVPRYGPVKFSELAARMIEKAAPYFGETLPGKVHFTDREGKVTPGEIKVIESDVSVPKK